MLIVLTTVRDSTEADFLAEEIVRARLAACVQILPPMTSFYVWEGNVLKESECLMLIKTPSEKYDELKAFIAARHSYETPEIIAIESAHCSTSYLQWMQQVTR